VLKLITAATLAGCVIAAAALQADAALVCVVADPSGTPLNVRAQPNSAIIGALHNGTRVVIRDETYDRKWVRVIPLRAGKEGWVFSNFLDCD
jgi:uncharacterized protein YraI